MPPATGLGAYLGKCRACGPHDATGVRCLLGLLCLAVVLLLGLVFVGVAGLACFARHRRQGAQVAAARRYTGATGVRCLLGLLCLAGCCCWAWLFWFSWACLVRPAQATGATGVRCLLGSCCAWLWRCCWAWLCWCCWACLVAWFAWHRLHGCTGRRRTEVHRRHGRSLFVGLAAVLLLGFVFWCCWACLLGSPSVAWLAQPACAPGTVGCSDSVAAVHILLVTDMRMSHGIH
jgi:hypothetical protein